MTAYLCCIGSSVEVNYVKQWPFWGSLNLNSLYRRVYPRPLSSFGCHSFLVQFLGQVFNIIVSKHTKSRKWDTVVVLYTPNCTNSLHVNDWVRPQSVHCVGSPISSWYPDSLGWLPSSKFPGGSVCLDSRTDNWFSVCIVLEESASRSGW